jgi:hypothetical protein
MFLPAGVAFAFAQVVNADFPFVIFNPNADRRPPPTAGGMKFT